MIASRRTTSRLDWSASALRWLLVVGVVILALVMPTLREESGEQLRGPLLLAAGLGVLYALVGTALASWSSASLTPGLVGLALDSVYVLVLFWASNGEPMVLLAAGALPVVTGSLCVGGPYGLMVAIVLAISGPLVHHLVIPEARQTTRLEDVVLAAGSLLLLATFIVIPTIAAKLGWVGERLRLREREADAAQLRDAREHARAVYEMSATLSATLNYDAVLQAALDVGVLGLRETGPSERLVSAVLLNDENTGQLKVANARRLTRADREKQVPGRQGVIGLARKQAMPVFASDPRRDPEMQYFVAFQDAQSILCVPLRAGINHYGVLLYGSTKPNAFSEEHVELLSAIASQAAIALQNATLYQDLLEEKERIIQVEEDARKQLSRSLHDGPVQDVSSIAMRADFVRRLLEREPDQVPPEIKKIEEIARQTVKQMRHMLFTLRPVILETQGLVPALEELASKMRDTHKQNVILQVEDGVEKHIDANDQTVLFNIVDECINNARKHAVAEHIWVRLGRRDKYLLLEVEDDGVGFDKGEIDANYDRRGSLGMINLRERAELLEGTLHIESAEGKGTKITLVAPIRDQN